MKNQTTNRLINESSPYLLQHASNPVQWYPWCEDASSEALKQDKPIMLSVGYAACHWCHVMEKESFEDEETAKIINENFIAIKVDREERPDVDDIYMAAVQLMTGHGGWPLTVFLTPQLKPFYGGTYFPKENRQYGQQTMPGFKTILKAVSRSWVSQRSEIEASADNVTSTINALNEKILEAESESSGEQRDDKEPVVESGLRLLSQFDKQWGGFGRAPKFPQALCLFLCLHLAYKLKHVNDSRHGLFLEAVRTSLDHMADGGIYDHLGGGFARYATDEKWLVPHFEKMLYDNALLAQLYLEAFCFTHVDHWRQIGCQTLDFMERELSAKNGAFYSSLDADSEGEEGKFYLWDKSEITKILGSDSDFFCRMFAVTDQGNFEAGKNVIYIDRVSGYGLRAQRASPLPGCSGQNADLMKEKLFAYRAQRVRPGLDKKVLASWNGLAISAFVTGYKVTGQEKYLEKAKNAGHFILANLYIGGRLKHVYAGGQAKFSGYLDDYAFFAQALIDLAGIDGNPVWLKKALDLTNSILKHFYDKKQADFFYTADDQEKLISRTKNSNDGPLPSATSVVVFNLIKLSIISGNESYKQIAQAVLDKYKPSFSRLPSQYANMAAAWDFAAGRPTLFIFITSGNETLDKPVLQALHSAYLPDKMVIIKDSRQYRLSDQGPDKLLDKRLTIFSDKYPLNNQPTVYMCNEYGCQPPLNDIDSIHVALKQLLKVR